MYASTNMPRILPVLPANKPTYPHTYVRVYMYVVYMYVAKKRTHALHMANK